MGQAKSVKPSEFYPAPGAVMAVDFETFYAAGYSVDELGTWAYCHDPRFAAWAVAVYDGVSSCVCKPADFPWDRISGLEWVSHNRDFDMGVYWRLYMQLGLFRACASVDWHCSAAACAFLQYPRDLAGACREVLGREVDKGVRKSSRNVRGADAARGQGTLFEMDLCDDESAYAASDAINCWDLWSAVGPQWPAHERRLFEMTSAMGRHGLFVDRATVKEKAVELTARREELAAGLPWKPALSAPKFDEACLGMGLTPPKSKAAGDENYMAWAEEHEGTLPAKWAADMAKIRRCGRLAKVLCAMDSRGKPDGRMAYDLKYFGTAPGGWAGGGGLNVQNFNRKEAAGVDIRKCIMAPPCHVLAVADYSQIQARILLHLAGDNVSLQFLVDHPDMDLYEVHARATMGWRPEREGESLDAFCERTGAVTRQLAKARTLGLGFQCAAETFIGTARRMAGLKLGITDARQIVREYRESNPKIVHLWKRLEADAAARLGGDFRLPLPCTLADPRCRRELIYRDVSRAGRGFECTVCGERVPLHGGILTQNWVYGTARDVLASAWLRLAAAGFRPVLCVHDELVFEVPEASAHEDLTKIISIMEQPLAWAEGLPLRVSGKLMSRYGK